MGLLHDDFNDLVASGADNKAKKAWLNQNVPLAEHKSFQATARQSRGRAADKAQPNSDLTQAHNVIGAELSSTPNPVKVEFRPTKDTWTSRFVPPPEVPGFAASNPSADMSFTFIDDNGEARQYHTTHGTGARLKGVPAGHATGGRLLVGARPTREQAGRANQGLPTVNMESFQTLGYGTAPYGVTPDIADRFKQTQAIQKSESELTKSAALPEPHKPPAELSSIGETVQLVKSFFPAGGEKAEATARMIHRLKMATDPEYRDSVRKAAGDLVTKEDVTAAAQTRMATTERNAHQRGIDTSTSSWTSQTRGVESREDPATAEALDPESGFHFEGSRDILPEHIGPEPEQDYVYPRELTGEDRRMRATYNMIAGIASGHPEMALKRLRGAEKNLGVEWTRPEDIAGPRIDYSSPIFGDSKLPASFRALRGQSMAEGVQAGVASREEERLKKYGETVRTEIGKGAPIVGSKAAVTKQVNQRVEAAMESEAARTQETKDRATDQAKIYWQMGTHPMYASAMRKPERLVEAAAALGADVGQYRGPQIGGRDIAGVTIPEAEQPMSDLLEATEQHHRRTTTIGYPADVYKKMAKREKAAAPAGSSGAYPLRDTHDAMRRMARDDLLGTIRSSAIERGLLTPRANEGAKVQAANGPAEVAIDGARVATHVRGRRNQSVPTDETYTPGEGLAALESALSQNPSGAVVQGGAAPPPYSGLGDVKSRRARGERI